MGYQPISLQRDGLITLAADSCDLAELIEISKEENAEQQRGLLMWADSVPGGISAGCRLALEGIGGVGLGPSESRGKIARPGRSANAVHAARGPSSDAGLVFSSIPPKQTDSSPLSAWPSIFPVFNIQTPWRNNAPHPFKSRNQPPPHVPSRQLPYTSKWRVPALPRPRRDEPSQCSSPGHGSIDG